MGTYCVSNSRIFFNYYIIETNFNFFHTDRDGASMMRCGERVRDNKGIYSWLWAVRVPRIDADNMYFKATDYIIISINSIFFRRPCNSCNITPRLRQCITLYVTYSSLSILSRRGSGSRTAGVPLTHFKWSALSSIFFFIYVSFFFFFDKNRHENSKITNICK